MCLVILNIVHGELWGSPILDHVGVSGIIALSMLELGDDIGDMIAGAGVIADNIYSYSFCQNIEMKMMKMKK